VGSQILCHVTAEMICGLKSLTFADSELSECHKFESIGWHEAGLWPGFNGKINCYGGKILFLLWYIFEKIFSGHKKLETLSLNSPVATGLA